MTGRERFLSACQGKAVDRTPIWIMRQAGRYLPQYRALRNQYSMDTALRDPAIAAEITLLPLKHFPLDAAIIFSDILPPLTAMGLDLAFVPGHGPRIGNPLRTPKAVDLLGVPPAKEAMGPTLKAIKIVRRELDARNLALIGFAGAPFTMASYAIEGGATRTFEHTKSFMYSEPAAWDRLMVKLSGMAIDYLKAQIAAGVDCVQLFDSWVGALSRYDYERYVKPYSHRVLSAVENSTVVIHFSTNTGTYLDAVAEAGGHVIGVDWRTPIDEASARVQKPVMGNLDPAALLAPWRELMPHAQEVMQRMEGQPGHVFNLGHGILPNTPVENVQRLVDYVHNYNHG
ncbi:MAG: uroporphyrinogen decarboxylase [Rhodothermaceae bacterium]|nr:uroporphyrinogen decarboxylase [Rhodothermaceae bacterium]MXX58930.1 uroporphyrinogen decarboxylase [Rhodothermaceae bacterium]MYD18766.1 uroporphyrinogen decarboxylase [Rhodothermaceae bacterium]MYD56637.1 uroporphyrinogen decarboxylase [Rhodothermaceae bacterium]MYI43600.1 uroporphyrinogen decarboxylase [Rhodothermaceae bacterium]